MYGSLQEQLSCRRFDFKHCRKHFGANPHTYIRRHTLVSRRHQEAMRYLDYLYLYFISSFSLTVCRLSNSSYPGLNCHKLFALTSINSFKQITIWFISGLSAKCHWLTCRLVEASSFEISFSFEVNIIVVATIKLSMLSF